MTRREPGPSYDGATPREQRLAAAGRVAAGLLHDVRNQLGTISNLAFVLERVADDPERVRDLAQRLSALTNAQSRVMQRLRDFVRQDVARFPDDAVVDLSAVARETVALCQGLAASNPAQGTLRFVCEAIEPVTVPGEGADLRAAVLELVLNAMEASPPSGTITVRTIWTSGAVRLEVRDEGPGFAEGMAQTACEPFISGKEEPDAGLGLSVVWSIARRHGGELLIETSAPGGATAALSFPRPAVDS